MAAEKRILLVDDYEPSVKISSALLKELGYEHDVACSGAEALEKLPCMNYALVIMDLQMPEMDGMDTTRKLRSMEREKNLSETPVMGMTGNATEDDRLFCLKAGMNDFISKPFRIQELENKIKNLLLPS